MPGSAPNTPPGSRARSVCHNGSSGSSSLVLAIPPQCPRPPAAAKPSPSRQVRRCHSHRAGTPRIVRARRTSAPIGRMARPQPVTSQALWPCRILHYTSFMVAPEAPDNESLRIELQEALVTYRHWVSQLTQAAGFFTTADVVLAGYGFSQRLAIILLAASAFPMLILVQ
jgi:hypothetical protein